MIRLACPKALKTVAEVRALGLLYEAGRRA